MGAAAEIRAMLAKKSSEKSGKKLILKDVNRDLIVALLAIPVYGKEARDEEILSIIINGGTVSTTIERIRTGYNERLKAKEFKKGKDGVLRDKDGFMVLVPRV